MFYNNLYNKNNIYNINRLIGGNNENNFILTYINKKPNLVLIINQFQSKLERNLESKLEHTIDINTNPYNITITSNDMVKYSEITYVAKIPTTIILPVIDESIEKMKINIINHSSSLVKIKTQNNELLFNSTYLPPNGSIEANLPPNKFCKLILTKKNNLFSYILLLT